MKAPSLPDYLKIKLRKIMRDHALAKFGDTLSNFIYSLAKSIASWGKPPGKTNPNFIAASDMLVPND